MTILPATSGDEDAERGKTKWRDALCVHARAEKVLRVVFKVGIPGPEKPHRYYRAILRGPGGDFHLAGGHVLLGPGGAYFEDTTPGTKSPFWIESCIGLRKALCRVNRFIPEHRAPRYHITHSILKGNGNAGCSGT